MSAVGSLHVAVQHLGIIYNHVWVSTFNISQLNCAAKSIAAESSASQGQELNKGL